MTRQLSPATLGDGAGPSRLETAVGRQLAAAADLQALLDAEASFAILLDTRLCIQLFSIDPAAPFHLVETDKGRPLADLRLVACDHTIHSDATHVLATGNVMERYITSVDGRVFRCRIEPLRSDGEVTGVVITLVDAAPDTGSSDCRIADHGTSASSVCDPSMAILSHELRQPLQTLMLLLYQLECLGGTPPEHALIGQCERIVGEMASTLDGMLMPVTAPNQLAVPDLDAGIARRTGTVLLVEDDSEVRELLADTLGSLGFHVMPACDAAAALDLVDQSALEPDVLLTDFQLPGALDGYALGMTLRSRVGRDIPVLILTGEAAPLDHAGATDCIWLTKPIQLEMLAQSLVNALTPDTPATASAELSPADITICLVDDDAAVRHLVCEVLVAEGFTVQAFADGQAFLAADLDPAATCLILDLALPGIDGHQLLAKLRAADTMPPTIVLTASGSSKDAVRAMQAGALDFLVKPVSRGALLETITRVMAPFVAGESPLVLRRRAREVLAGLTARQRDVMAHILAGEPNKIIAANLAVSQRTVENHRAAIMRRTGARSLPDLARLSIAAGL